MRYGITADELHDRIIESLLSFSKHMSLGAEEILQGHEEHPLEQIIKSVIMKAYNRPRRTPATGLEKMNREELIHTIQEYQEMVSALEEFINPPGENLTFKQVEAMRGILYRRGNK